MKTDFKLTKTLLVLVRALGVLVPLGSIAWMCGVLIQARRLPAGDAAHFIATEARLADLLLDGEIFRAAQLFWTLLAPHPPLGYLPGVLGQLVWPDAIVAALIGQGLVMVVLWDAFVRIARGIEPGEPGISAIRGLGAWFVGFGGPMVWLAVDQHGRDLVVGAAALQCLSHLYASNGLRIRTNSLGFGVWMGVGFLTKYTFPMFLLLPCLLSIGALRTADRRANLGRSIAAFLMVAGPWYLTSWEGVRGYLSHSADHTSLGNTRVDLLAAESLAFYPLALKDSLGWPGVVMLLVGGGLWLVRGWGAERARLPWVVWAGALSGVAVLSTVAQAQDRYATPAVLCLASLALGFRGWWMLIPLSLGLTQTWYSARAFAPGARNVATSYLHPLSSAGELSWPRSAWYRPSSVSLESWGLDRAFETMASTQGEQGTVGLLLGDRPFIPSFGSVVLAAQGAGYGWDYAVVKVQRPGWTVFRGPLFDGEWPPAEFDTLLSVLCDGEQELAAWRQSRVVQNLYEAQADGGCRVRVDVVETGPLPAMDGPTSERLDAGAGGPRP